MRTVLIDSPLLGEAEDEPCAAIVSVKLGATAITRTAQLDLFLSRRMT